MPPSSLFLRLAPGLFVILWSTGWISARAAAPYADPLSFLAIRFWIASFALCLIALLTGSRWPRTAAAWGHMAVSGVLLHAIYLGGVWWALRHGLSAGITGILAAVQPILTAVLAPWLARERISLVNWLGVLFGVAGIGLVLAPKLDAAALQSLESQSLPILTTVLGMVSVTLGTFYQKRFLTRVDVMATTCLQYGAAGVATLPAALLLESNVIVWNGQTEFAMAWTVLGLSIGAMGLYLLLINTGAVSRSASLIFLIPPAVALQAYLFFGEELGPVQLAGMVLAAAGVALASRRR